MAATCVKYDDGSGYYAKNGFPPRKKFSSRTKDTGLCDAHLVCAEVFFRTFHLRLVLRSVKIHGTQSSVYATQRENFPSTQP